MVGKDTHVTGSGGDVTKEREHFPVNDKGDDWLVLADSHLSHSLGGENGL